MRTLGGFAFALVLATGLSAQSRGSVVQTTTGGFGSVVFPGGTPATSPNVTRTFGSVLNPGGGGPRLVVPNGVQPWFSRPPVNGQHHTGTGTGTGATYAYPVYVFGGYGGYGGYYDANAPEQGGPPQQQQQQPNITVIMPPAQPATPVIINVGPGGGQYTTTGRQQGGVNEPQPEPATAAAEPLAIPDQQERYLLAFKDHSIYSASAYWVDGDTLHYFTSGNTHNQASLSLLDRPLTERLNKEFGVEFKVPAEK